MNELIDFNSGSSNTVYTTTTSTATIASPAWESSTTLYDSITIEPSRFYTVMNPSSGDIKNLLSAVLKCLSQNILPERIEQEISKIDIEGISEVVYNLENLLAIKEKVAFDELELDIIKEIDKCMIYKRN